MAFRSLDLISLLLAYTYASVLAFERVVAVRDTPVTDVTMDVLFALKGVVTTSDPWVQTAAIGSASAYTYCVGKRCWEDAVFISLSVGIIAYMRHYS